MGRERIATRFKGDGLKRSFVSVFQKKEEFYRVFQWGRVEEGGIRF
jgi:hypothetical protein